MERTKLILGHLNNRSAVHAQTTAAGTSQAHVSAARDDDVVIVSALRTPICKAKRGGFKDSTPIDLLTAVFQAVIKDAGIQPSDVQDICVGNVNQPGAGASAARMAQFAAQIPETVTLHAVNRYCSSGLQACASIAASIKAGYIDIGIGAGVECMSIDEKRQDALLRNPKIFEDPKVAAVLVPMGITSENVASQFNVTREKQDSFSQLSHAKAAAAQKQGLFNDEIVPVTTRLQDKDGNETTVVISKDDGIRADTTMAGLAKLKPAFQEGGSTTAGNSSQVSDGAAAVILARRSYALKNRLPIIGVFRSFAVVGVPPEVMGIGPAYAIPEALRKAGLTLDDIDIFEINEAFASQAVYCVEKLGIPLEKVNPKGGAVALGHPLGCTGARQIATLLHEFKRRQKRAFGVVSMCIGTGMGAAAVIEYPSA